MASSKTCFVRFICMFCSLAITLKADSQSQVVSQNWLNHGGDIYNRRYAYHETKISPLTARNLHLRWEFNAGLDISATPAIFKGTIYFPSWNGYLYAVKAHNGALVWKKNLQELTGLIPNGSSSRVILSRSTPTIADDGKLMFIGIYGPAVVIAVKRSNGALVWSKKLDPRGLAIITMSGTCFKKALYIGVSSSEELLSIEQCCTFRGSFVKVDSETGSVLWQTYTLPDNGGSTNEYSGASLWGSSPSIDACRNSVYIATGNLYTAPQRVLDCQAIQNNQTTPIQPDKCVEPEDHSNSILAMDLDSGEIKWYKQLGGYDVWILACFNSSTPSCPPAGTVPDADFAEAPMMLTIVVKGIKREIVVAVQKSGFAWALDRDNGDLVWFTEAGPGSEGGGGTWGAAADHTRVYTNIANARGKTFKLSPSNETTTSGGWVAMDASTGQILWTTANPSNATASGPVTIANGVLFAGSMYKTGPLYAMNAITGQIMWSYETGASLYSGVSVSDGCIYIGNGYGRFGPATGTFGTSMFAFCV